MRARTAAGRSRRTWICSRACALGGFDDGTKTLRAKIDMTSGNINLRDPVMYRIRKASHHRTGDAWCIYPMYDWAHGQSDSIEGITHSICTLEYEDHRPLYDWYLDQLGVHHPQQIEFARLNLSHTVLSSESCSSWSSRDSSPAGTIRACRRWRGCGGGATRPSPSVISPSASGPPSPPRSWTSRFSSTACAKISTVAPSGAWRVVRPLKLVIENYPEGQVEAMEAVNNPEDPGAGSRKVPFSGVLYIEQDDFRDPAPPKYFRLSPGTEVRLRYAYIVKCTGVERDSAGQVTTVRCTYDPDSRGGDSRGRRVKGTIHWVSASHSIPAEVRLYDHLFSARQARRRRGLARRAESDLARGRARRAR